MQGDDQLREYSTGVSVLYVEDDDIVRNTTSKILSRYFEGNIVSVSNGKEGVEEYMRGRFDIVIADIYMPVMNGIKMTKRIREMNSEQIVIVTTAYNDYQYLLELIAIGINYFILKPLEPTKLTAVLYRACRKIYNERYLEECRKQIEETVKKQTFELDQTRELLHLEVNRRQQIEAQLIAYMKAGEGIFKEICLYAPDATVVMNDEGVISFWNNAAEAMFGYTQAEAIGKELHRLVAPQQHCQRYTEALERLRQSAQDSSREGVGKATQLEAVNKVGEVFAVELSGWTISTADGKLYTVGIFIDITGQRQGIQ
ncbi:protein containing Signal transduction response regulator, receiver region [Candidatus Magnetobacterium bavaricum]|uniref:Protein containing Signal transduction response regulator, receiver region n=1 Tax=Candidatus Magnetobacterium bavaricum TaxID=29290 RepID=A0A0F3GTG9_9BACT|nr:protein containing Signal transduction response regulator, receiver region [Candidatus Magnetobacterium bavaricum]